MIDYIAVMETINNCLECGRPLHGRADQKFCSPQCRTSYNNKLNSDANKYMRNVNRILRKNRRILLELNPNGKMIASRKKMTGHGFDFKFFTNVYKTKSGKVYYFCYDQGYLPLENDNFALVVREEYID